MVQQPFAGSQVGPQTVGGGQTTTVAETTTLAMPAIISNSSGQSSHYSPQANYYQQQLIKSAQHQFMQHQQPQQQPARLNGLPNATNSMQVQQQQYSSQQQQDSPSSQAQTVEGLYNGVAQARPAPIYAPKPAYYGAQSSAGQQQPLGQSQPQQQQPMYQQRATQQPPQPQQTYYQQQQQHHSPASLSRVLQPNGPQMGQQQAAQVGLSVRQLSGMQMNGILGQLPPVQSSMSPMQPATDQQRQQQQMQHLIMSYQHQQLSSIQPNANEMLQPNQQQAAYIHSISGHNMQEQLVQQHVDVRWSQIEEQRQLQHHQLMSQAFSTERVAREQSARPRFSDRDSISTLSRFNQFDERRSITMRSQCTNANNASRYSRQFSFLKLTSEALKTILGLSGANKSPASGVDKQNLHRNLNLSVSGINGNSNKQPPFGSANSVVPPNQRPTTKITVIDSGEDYYFKKKVFKYQLIILRLISLLSCAFVLLSPVAMLLIPKMESLFNGHTDYTGAADSSSSAGTTAIDGHSQTQPVPSITHAVGLTGNNKQAQQQQQQQPYFMPQPQWRISECTSDCDGPLIGFVARLIMLSVAYWAIFFRAQTATLPRIDFHRCLLTSMAVLLTLAYWLFFIFRVFDKRYNDFELQYMTIVQFSLSMLESLILLHYLAVVLLELRHRKKAYCLKVVRSPDGASQYYSCGALSIQKCAQFVLEKYHRDFKQYGPYAEHLLELENQLAQNVSGGKREEPHIGVGGDKSPRSRPSSPANSHRGDTIGGRASRRSASRSSRHHSKSGTHNRSPSRSPVRSSRSRSQKKSVDNAEGANDSRSNQVKLYQVDLNPPDTNSSNNNNNEDQSSGVASDKNNANSSSRSNFQNNNNQVNPSETKQHENDSNSADQSSDATSRMKESSLETIRAANSTSDLLLSQQKTSAPSKVSSGSKNNRNATEDQRTQHQQQSASRDETESVRSVRSRRSTMRSHHRSHRDHRDYRDYRDHRDHHHRERSSSRVANDHSDDHRHSHSVSVPMQTSVDPLEDHEQKLRRRKFRLLTVVQDTFEQIKQIDEVNHNNQQLITDSSTSLTPQQQQPKQALGPNQAARSLYPNIARSLQKYLRLTKQTGRHNLQSIYEHLSKCLLYKLSARAFLEKFINHDSVWQQSETSLFANCRLIDSMVMNPRQRADDLEINSWSLVCDTLLSRQVDSGTFFVLKQGQVSLLVTVAKLPHLNLSEEVINQKSCKFTLGPNSESSV